MSVTMSATLAANEAIARKRRSGAPVLPMAFGEAGLPVHPTLSDALAAAAGRNAYGPVAGSADLRGAAAGYWGRRGLPTDPAQVICGPGSKPLLYGLLLAIGGDVVVPGPSWVSYAAQARLAGREPIFVPTPPGQGGVPEPELLTTAVTEARRAGRDVRAVVVTLPDNPTGTIAQPETVRRLCAAARELDLVIVADEIYRDLIHDPAATPLSCPSSHAPERTVITTALSKNLALGGWRIGVARLPDGPLGTRLRDELLGIVSEIWSSPSGPIQQAAAYAFGEPAELVEHIAASTRLHATVARAVAEAFTAAGALVVPPQAAFYCYPDFEPRRGHLYEKYGTLTGADLSSVLLEEYGVGVLPASEFGEPATALRLRVASSLLYGETTEQRETALASGDPVSLPWIDAALRRLRTVLADLLD
ncbi:MAG: aminotransferase class I/II-fold pyridoxal phosphate-dependent enzyme [Streptosporangiales bacterium]|nr:aminotransferase class I/II-fold pyridoxal phosphate-dependent enzyme [Streptosporangiales bacterium]